MNIRFQFPQKWVVIQGFLSLVIGEIKHLLARVASNKRDLKIKVSFPQISMSQACKTMNQHNSRFQESSTNEPSLQNNESAPSLKMSCHV